MKKTSVLLTVITFLIVGVSKAQIKLPKGFHCVLGENHANESFFTDGTYSFSSYPWGHDGIYGQEVIDLLEKNYSNRIKFSKTKDGLYWATGKVGDFYIYTIIANQALQFTLRSKTNDTEFSNYSTWLLQEIRNNIKSEHDNYYTDYNGNSCSGMK